MLMVQAKLRRDGNVFTVTWIPYDSRLKPGVKLTTGKNSPEWEIVELWAKQEMDTINSDWKVGGL